MKQHGVADSPRWTHPEAYVEALARASRSRQRTEPEAPRMLLSTLPFMMLIALLGLLAVAIMIMAFPGSRREPRPVQAAAKQEGVAAKGWLQEAAKDFHH